MADPFEKEELKKKYPSEQVYVVPFFNGSHIVSGYTPVDVSPKETYSILSKWQENGRFVMRYDAEGNTALTQLIPYTLILNPERTKIFVAVRKGGDSRLVSKYSLGFGGHINPCDAGYLILTAASRELDEELTVLGGADWKFLGYVRDLTSDTKEHLGFVFLKQADKVLVKETENMDGRWMDIDDLVNYYYKFESWSKFLIDYLFIVSTNGRLFGEEFDF